MSRGKEKSLSEEGFEAFKAIVECLRKNLDRNTTTTRLYQVEILCQQQEIKQKLEERAQTLEDRKGVWERVLDRIFGEGGTRNGL